MGEQLFSQWQLLLSDLCSTEKRVTFKKDSNNKLRVQECFQNKFIYNTLLKWIYSYAHSFQYRKNDKEAAQYRKKGNDLFLTGRVQQSLCYYTKAIFLAPRNSEEIQLAFGNRSAALFTLEKYQECLRDISYATTKDNPPTLRDVRLIIRKAKAHEVLDDFTEAMDAYNLADTMIIDCSNPDDKKFKQLKDELYKNMECLKKKLDETKNKSLSLKSNSIEIDVEFRKILTNFKSAMLFPDISKKLTIRRSCRQGRYIVAHDDISFGEVLFLEKPFAFVILPNYAFQRCQGCCKETINPLPCKHCSEACFCSEGCRRISWNKFHKFECGLGLDLNYMIGIAHLGFRVAITGLNNPTNEDYARVLSLEDHIKLIHEDDLYQYTLTATLLIIYLEKFTNIFSEVQNREESLIEFGGIILLHIAQMICNGHAITDYIESPEGESLDVFTEQEVRIATAIYPSASLMNHSCDPSVINSFHNDCLIVRSIKQIKKGEEVYNCYGPHFRRMKREERRSSLLQQYRFKCNCKQCVTEVDFCERFSSFSCPNKSCPGFVLLDKEKCYRCQLPLSIRRIDLIKAANEKLNEAKTAASVYRYTDSINLAETALKVYTEYLYMYNIKILECRDFMSKTFTNLGRYYESYKLIEDNLEGNRERFGPNSVEVANELMKLNDIAVRVLKLYIDDPQSLKKNSEKYKLLFNTIVQYSEQAKVIYKIYFGKLNQKYKDIKQQLKLINFSLSEITQFLNS